MIPSDPILLQVRSVAGRAEIRAARKFDCGFDAHVGRLGLLSHDYSLVQELVDASALRPEQALHYLHANVITRAVGADKGRSSSTKGPTGCRPATASCVQ